ncbi:tripartite tricarboxylate transporter permease [Virgibacillus sp. C22-A2]|uniref:Tripartite tricarboxylate transporter permease n=1 Tax=Virgibacillus tibetensis TaxID=3042313 RepID=A0ABU6KFU4_9BACI|nr:tripartite tricarboxylate transporter permease [Virgibacillus sp. C22-A2]
MDNFFLLATQEILNWSVLSLIIIGTICGIISGAIPGFTVTMGIVLAFPFTFAMDAISGLALMSAVLVGGYSGGLISGIMLGIPGTPSSITTIYDGYPMAKRGEPGRALGIGVASSFIGTILSVFVLTTIGPLVARFSLNFGPWEIATLILFALTLVGSLSEGAMIKGLMSGAIGLLIATTGVSAWGQVRFNFGFEALTAGFQLLPVLIGAFAFSQMLENIEQMKENKKQGNEAKKVNMNVHIPYALIIKDVWKQKLNILRSSLIGSLIGAIPAAGGTAANFVSYDQAKKFSKNPERFGKGDPAGVAASESSNNAVVGGAFIPTLTLGIPGNVPMAIMMGVLILHGITPGPMLFSTQPVLVGSIYVSLLVAAIVLVIVMFFLIRVFTKIAQVPQSILVPTVLMLAAVGSFALNNSLFDIWTLFIFGIVGYLLSKGGVPLAPLVLGLVLGSEFEKNLFRALELSPEWTAFLTRPISGTMVILMVASIIFAIWQSYKVKKKMEKKDKVA